MNFIVLGVEIKEWVQDNVWNIRALMFFSPFAYASDLEKVRLKLIPDNF